MAKAKAKVTPIERDGIPVGMRWTFADGTVRERYVSEYPEAIQQWFTAHGLKQKESDCYAGKENTVADCIVLHDAMHEQLMDDTWNLKGGGGINLEDLAQAIATVIGGDIENIRQRVRDMSKEEIDEMRKKFEQIDVELDRIRLERKKARVKDGEGTVEDLMEMFS